MESIHDGFMMRIFPRHGVPWDAPGRACKKLHRRKFLDLKREVRRFLASYMIDFDIYVFKKRADKT